MGDEAKVIKKRFPQVFKLLALVIFVGLLVAGGFFVNNFYKNHNSIDKVNAYESPDNENICEDTKGLLDYSNCKDGIGKYDPNYSTREPSERSLKVASELYTYQSKTDQKTYIANWSSGTGNSSTAIKNYALYLDTDSAALALHEADIERYKNEINKPSTPVYQQPSINCNTYTYGNMSQTNCY